MWLVRVARRRRNDPRIPDDILKLGKVRAWRTSTAPGVDFSTTGLPYSIVEAVAEVSESSNPCRTAEGDGTKSRRMLTTPLRRHVASKSFTQTPTPGTSTDGVSDIHVLLLLQPAARHLPRLPLHQWATHKQDMAWIPPASRSTYVHAEPKGHHRRLSKPSTLAGYQIDKLFNHVLVGDRKKSIFPPPTFTKVRFSSLNSKTEQITSLNFSNRAFYLPGAVSKAVLLP
jgi:hypothetical protein